MKSTTRSVNAKPDASRCPVVIANRKHPHYGRRGYIAVTDGTVTVHTDICGRRMVRVEFTDNDPVGAAAFAYAGDFRRVTP